MIETIITVLAIAVIGLLAHIRDVRRKHSELFDYAVDLGQANARLMVERNEASAECGRLEDILRQHKSDILDVRRMVFALSKASEAPVEWPKEIDVMEVETNG